jgi:hypothetical protein
MLSNLARLIIELLLLLLFVCLFVCLICFLMYGTPNKYIFNIT